LCVAKEKRAFLTYPAEGLAPCTLEETEEGVEFLIDTEGLEPSETVRKRPREEQLRFLINCADLEKLSAEYAFSLAPGNLLVDRNLRPLVLVRDVQQNAADFLPEYKALIGSLLLQKYSYEDFRNGGQDIYGKNKLTAELAKLETVAEVKERLIEAYTQAMEHIRACKCTVSKRRRLAARIVIPVLIALLGAAAFFAVRAMFWEIPHQDAVIAANTAYIAGDHLSVQRILTDIPLERLSDDTKYFLARSYVTTEALTDAQRRNVLVGLTRLTDPVIFDYWILSGRLQMEEALDLARRLNDNELMLFAYIKYRAIIDADITIPGDEKVALLASLDRQIENLQRARDAAAVAADTP